MIKITRDDLEMLNNKDHYMHRYAFYFEDVFEKVWRKTSMDVFYNVRIGLDFQIAAWIKTMVFDVGGTS